MPDHDTGAAQPQLPDFQRLFETTPGPYLILAPHSAGFRIVAVNDAYLRATLTHRDDIVGRDLFDVFPDNPDDPTADGVRKLRASLQTVVATCTANTMEVQRYDIPSHDGTDGFTERYWTPINIPVCDETGMLSHIIHHVEDVTALVQLSKRRTADDEAHHKLRTRTEWLEAEIIRRSEAERARDTLLECERMRTAELEVSNDLLQQQAIELEYQAEEAHSLARDLEESNHLLGETLREVESSRLAAERERSDADDARKAAETANAAKGRFLAAMSHELRTPLNAIGGYVQLLEMEIRGPVTSEQALDLERIRMNEQHLLRLINDVLDFTQLDAGHVQYRLATIPLDATLRSAEVMILPQLRSCGLQYVYEGCDERHAIRADSDKVQQIMLNILGNAIKFTPRGGQIRVRCEKLGHAVRVYVTDTGTGIAAEKIDTIFNPFVQGDRRLNQPMDGIGLGLAISRELARGMGGDLSAKSECGIGSTFMLDLPLATKREWHADTIGAPAKRVAHNQQTPQTQQH